LINPKELEYLKKVYKLNEAAKLSGVHINTFTKINKLGLVDNKNELIRENIISSQIIYVVN